MRYISKCIILKQIWYSKTYGLPSTNYSLILFNILLHVNYFWVHYLWAICCLMTCSFLLLKIIWSWTSLGNVNVARAINSLSNVFIVFNMLRWMLGTNTLLILTENTLSLSLVVIEEAFLHHKRKRFIQLGSLINNLNAVMRSSSCKRNIMSTFLCW